MAWKVNGALFGALLGFLLALSVSYGIGPMIVLTVIGLLLGFEAGRGDFLPFIPAAWLIIMLPGLAVGHHLAGTRGWSTIESGGWSALAIFCLIVVLFIYAWRRDRSADVAQANTNL